MSSFRDASGLENGRQEWEGGRNSGALDLKGEALIVLIDLEIAWETANRSSDRSKSTLEIEK